MNRYHIAQLTLARMAAPYESPLFDDFRANVDRIDALAARSPGFVWRLESDEDADSPFGENMLASLTVWEAIEPLFDFVYRSDHAAIMRQRRNWFEKMEEPGTVLWWIPAGNRPTEHEALERLNRLRSEGSTPEAFSLKQSFPPPDS